MTTHYKQRWYWEGRSLNNQQLLEIIVITTITIKHPEYTMDRHREYTMDRHRDHLLRIVGRHHQEWIIDV